MGAFFTNIQILCPTQIDKKTFSDELVNIITKTNTRKKLTLTDTANEADKSVIISSKTNGPWVSVYDEEAEEQNLKNLQKLSGQLSKSLKTTCLAILVNDSNYIYVGLFDNGTLTSQLDNFSDDIDFSQIESKSWSKLLKNGHSFDDIISAWKNKGMFVENFLQTISDYFDINSEEIITGFRYIIEEGVTEQTVLNFKDKAKKPIEPLGPVEFALYAGTGGITFDSNDNSVLQWILTNQGLASNGLRIVMAGSAIEKEIIKPVKVNICRFRPYELDKVDFSSTFEERISTNKEKLYVATVPDISIATGIKPNYPMNARQVKKYSDESFKSAIVFNIELTRLAKGNEELMLWFTPTENPDGAYWTGSLPVDSK